MLDKVVTPRNGTNGYRAERGVKDEWCVPTREQVRVTLLQEWLAIVNEVPLTEFLGRLASIRARP